LGRRERHADRQEDGSRDEISSPGEGSFTGEDTPRARHHGRDRGPRLGAVGRADRAGPAQLPHLRPPRPPRLPRGDRAREAGRGAGQRRAGAPAAAQGAGHRARGA